MSACNWNTRNSVLRNEREMVGVVIRVVKDGHFMPVAQIVVFLTLYKHDQ